MQNGRDKEKEAIRSGIRKRKKQWTNKCDGYLHEKTQPKTIKEGNPPYWKEGNPQSICSEEGKSAEITAETSFQRAFNWKLRPFALSPNWENSFA